MTNPTQQGSQGTQQKQASPYDKDDKNATNKEGKQSEWSNKSEPGFRKDPEAMRRTSPSDQSSKDSEE